VTRLIFGGHNSIELAPVGSADNDEVEIPGDDDALYIVGIDHNPAQEFQTFLYDKYEVTNAKYKAFVDAGGYGDPAYWDDLPIPFEEAMDRFTDRSGRPGPATWEAGDYPAGHAEYPVSGVSWYEAMAYASWAGRSLPTVYHWNKAAVTPVSYIIVPGTNLAGDGPLPVGSNNSMTWFDQYDLAGNVREWTYNLGREGQRFILGGGWNDPTYGFNDAYSQDAFDRSPTNGFRTIQYIGEEPNLAALQAPIDQPFRDYSQEKPVSDAEFELFRRMYNYDRTPLNAEIEGEDDSSEVWIHQTVTFDAAYGDGDERVIAHVYLPKSGTPPYQTIVFFPGSNGIHDRSFGVTQGTMNFLDFLIRDGRAFVWPIYKGTYERGTDLDSDYQETTIRYKDHETWWVKDLRRTIDYLETRDDIDADNLAYFGWSWGGAQGPIMTALEPRFKASILLVAGLAMQNTLPETDPWNYLPRVTAPTLMLNGRYDFFFPVETAQKPFFDALGLPNDQKRMIITDQGHTVTRELLMRETFAWLDRWLDDR
jgi:dienelactone hydrolase